MRPRTSPRPMRVPAVPGAVPVIATSSPSSRNVRVLAVGQRDRLGPSPAQLEQRAPLVLLRAGHGAAREDVPGTQGRTVDGQVRELLRRRPVHGGERRPGDDVAVERHLQLQVQPRLVDVAQVGQQRRVTRRRGDAGGLQRVQRHHPRRDGRGERLAEERPERRGLPRLDVARATSRSAGTPRTRARRRRPPRPTRRPAWPCPTTNPTSASMSSRVDGPNSGAASPRRCPLRPDDVGAGHHDRAGSGRGSRSGGASSSASAARSRAGRSVRRSWRGARWRRSRRSPRPRRAGAAARRRPPAGGAAARPRARAPTRRDARAARSTCGAQRPAAG